MDDFLQPAFFIVDRRTGNRIVPVETFNLQLLGCGLPGYGEFSARAGMHRAGRPAFMEYLVTVFPFQFLEGPARRTDRGIVDIEDTVARVKDECRMADCPEDRFPVLLCVEQRVLGNFAIRDVPDRLDRPDNIPAPVVEGACLPHQRDFPPLRTGERSVGDQDVFIMNNMGIILRNNIVCFEDQVDEDLSPCSIERNSVLKITFPQHLGSRNTGHLLDGTVPRDDMPAPVDGKGRVGEKVNDICKALF